MNLHAGCSSTHWFLVVRCKAGEPERPEPHPLARAILFFSSGARAEAEHFKKLEWSRSWHKLVRLQTPTVFKNFVKQNNF